MTKEGSSVPGQRGTSVPGDDAPPPDAPPPGAPPPGAPQRGAADAARHRALSAASRIRMLALIRAEPDGMTAADLVTATGLHPSTVRAHLDQLVESGLLDRRRQGDGSPGRPAWRYAAVPGVEAGAHAHADQPYRDLAAALIGQLARDADDPHAAAVRAGRDWGRSLVAPLTGAGSGPARVAPVDGLVRVLDQLGFSPQIVQRPGPGAVVLALRSCPFVDLARRHADVVCGVHQGVIGGALGALGAPSSTELEPFAAPGACLVRVRPRDPE